MISTKPHLKIVWAFDPYQDEPELWDRSVELLHQLSQKSELSIQPVYVLGASTLPWIGRITPEQWTNLIPIVKKEIHSRLQNYPIQWNEPEVLSTDRNDRRSEIEAMAQYLEETRPSFTLLNAHARTGLSRFVMGSFSENLMLISNAPFVFVNPQTEPIRSLERILLLTDFSNTSRGFFNHLLSQTGFLFKELVLFSKIFHPTESLIQSGVAALGGGWFTLDQYLPEEVGTRTTIAESWAKEASDSGLKVSHHIDDRPGDLLQSLDAYLNANPVDAVALHTCSSAIETKLIGSIGREVTRWARVPIYVRHYEHDHSSSASI